MLYTLIVQSHALNHCAKALEFAKQILHEKNQLNLVFFLFDGAYLANKYIEQASDEPNLGKLWQELGRQYQIPLIVCSASGARRGICAATLADKFTLGSIGQLVTVCEQSQQVVVL